MIKLKKLVLFGVNTLIILGLSACAPEDPHAVTVEQTQESEEGVIPTDIENNTADSSSIEQLLLNTPDHISKIYNDTFSVEADVHVPKVKKADILYASYMPFDEQKLLTALYEGKTPQRSVSDVDDSVIYQDDRSSININKGFLSYATQEFEYYKLPTDNLSAKSDILSFGRKFSEVYQKDNLGFMERSKALENVSNVLNTLSIEVAGNSEIYAIDSATMQKEQQEEIQKQEEIQRQMDVSNEDPTLGYQVKNTFTNEDDFYLFFFQMMQNEIPVTQKSYNIQASERSLLGSTAEVALSRNGMIQLYLAGIYQQQGIVESPSTLISLDEALQKAYEKLNEVISTDKETITSIDFEYVPVPYNSNYDEVELVPTWSMTVLNKTTSNKPSKDGKGFDTTESYHMMFINAVTGEQIQ